MNNATDTTPAERLPIPDLATATSAEIRALIESWRYRGAPVSFGDVIGHEAAVEAMRRLATLLHLSAEAPERVAALGIRSNAAGACICGPSGTGKTLLARATATAAGGDRRVYIVPTALLTVELIERVYAELADMPASVAIIDEAERLIGRYPHLGADPELKVAFLAALDGMDQRGSGGCATVALTTLGEDEIERACVRPGRLSPVCTLSNPSRADRRRMWELELSRRPCGEVSADRLAELTEGGWTGAEIAGACEQGAIKALCDGRAEVAQADLEICVATRFRETDASVKLPPDLLDADHESGHAVWAAMGRGIQSVVDVRLTERGEGHTISLHVADGNIPEESSPDRMTRLTLEGARFEAIGCLAGAAAVRIVAGEVTAGSSNDLGAATTYAAKIIDMGAPSSYHFHESQYRGESATGSDAMREERWRAIDAILVELRGEAERWAAQNAHRITAFAEALFAAPDYHLTGADLSAALGRALAIE